MFQVSATAGIDRLRATNYWIRSYRRVGRFERADVALLSCDRQIFLADRTARHRHSRVAIAVPDPAGSGWRGLRVGRFAVDRACRDAIGAGVPSVRGFAMGMRGEYFFTSESVSEGHPGQGLRPDLRCGARRLPRRRSRGAGRLRDLRDDRPGGGRRRGAGAGRRARAGRGDRARLRARHRLRAEGLQLGDAPGPQLHPRPVRAHRPGRRRRRRQGGGRGRPGHHVRLRDRRDARADAGADPLRPRGAAPAVGGAQERRGAAARAGRQGAAVAALRRRQAGRGLVPGALDPASRRGDELGARCGRCSSPTSARCCPRAG